MILQCDQCNTKFRLDDSKLKPGGVKVRCSKCRHVFVAGAESKPEESDFDALLSGLGAPAPVQPAAQAAAPAPVAQPAPPAATPAAEPAPAAAAPSAATGDLGDFPDFDFTPEPAAAKEPAAPAAQDDGLAAGGLEFGEFAFDEEAPPLKEEPAAAAAVDFGEFDLSPDAGEPAAEQKTAPREPDFGFGEFDFDSAPAIQRQQTPAPELDFGDISFGEEPVAKAEPPAAAKGDFDFEDFSFTEEPSAKEEAPAAAKEEFDFDDFSFNEQPAVKEEAPAAAKGDFDFGDFTMSEEPALKPETPAAKEEFDFGDFSVSEEPAVKAEEPAAPKGEFDFGDFSFSETPTAKAEETPAKADFDFSDFSFSEEPPPIKEEAPADSFDDFFTSASHQQGGGKGAGKEEAFGGFSLGEEKEAAAVAPFAAGATPSAGATDSEGSLAGKAFQEQVAPLAPAAEPKPASPAKTLDFSFGAKPGVLGGAEESEEDEDLPPLNITSRRKGRSAVSVALVAIAAVLVLTVTGAGLYLLQSGPAALATFDKVGLGFVGKWFGMEAPDEGKITISKPVASFYQNKEAGELFVVTGQAVNNFKKARASIHVKVSIFDKKGAVIMQKTAYCGNKLSKDQLETLPMAKIEQIMNNSFGDSLSNLGVKPGQSIGFVVALANVPKDAADFGVEVLGSTVSGQ